MYLIVCENVCVALFWEFSCSVSIPDDFNRVILSMRRGQEFTDYINASFIDVSDVLWPRSFLLAFIYLQYVIGTALHRLYWACKRKVPCVLLPQGYRQKDYFIATQGPVPHTVEDFWRMVWEWKCHSIVMLTELQEREQVSCERLPHNNTEIVACDDRNIAVTTLTIYITYI